MYIAIEWTSAAFRALLMDDDKVLEERRSDRGTVSVPDRAFEAILREELGDWAGKAERILLSGMITSRNGWIESPFVPTPAGPLDLPENAVRHNIAGLPPLLFLPGIAQTQPLPDVMRGEEMSLFGLAEADGLFVLPGPHAKWVRMKDGRITGITTYMSGEILNLLKRDSLVSRLIPLAYEEQPQAFRRGVLTAYNEGALPGRILARIFSARSLVLFGLLKASEISDYLSGLMIGAEIFEALHAQEEQRIYITGHSPLAHRYATALGLFGKQGRVLMPDLAAGFRKVAASRSDSSTSSVTKRIAD